jgi:hypothetical protein
MALAAKWQEEGKTHLAEFVANRGPKIVNEAMETAKELNEAQERLKRANKTRIELLEESAASACVDGCQGEWLSAAKEILDTRFFICSSLCFKTRQRKIP